MFDSGLNKKINENFILQILLPEYKYFILFTPEIYSVSERVFFTGG